jgi:four helix bundle protein
LSYKTLEIWQLARDVSIGVQRMTIELLPKFEFYEEGSQIRRSAKSIRSNIVEGYGRRRYKQEFIRFLTYAHASCDETIDHLETLIETGSLEDDAIFKKLHDQLDQLGAKLNLFIRSVESQHLSVREEGVEYSTGGEHK